MDKSKINLALWNKNNGKRIPSKEHLSSQGSKESEFNPMCSLVSFPYRCSQAEEWVNSAQPTGRTWYGQHQKTRRNSPVLPGEFQNPFEHQHTENRLNFFPLINIFIYLNTTCASPKGTIGLTVPVQPPRTPLAKSISTPKIDFSLHTPLLAC